MQVDWDTSHHPLYAHSYEETRGKLWLSDRKLQTNVYFHIKVVMLEEHVHQSVENCVYKFVKLFQNNLPNVKLHRCMPVNTRPSESAALEMVKRKP